MKCPICDSELENCQFVPGKLDCPRSSFAYPATTPDQHVYTIQPDDGVESMIYRGYRIHRAKIHPASGVPLTSVYPYGGVMGALRDQKHIKPVFEVQDYLEMNDLDPILNSLDRNKGN